MNATSAATSPSIAGADDQRAEDEEGEHLEDRADVLVETRRMPRGSRARRRPSAIPATKAAIRPLPKVTSASAEGDAARSRARRCPRSARYTPPGSRGSSRPAQNAEQRRRSRPRTPASPSRLERPPRPASPPGCARIRKKSTKGSARPSLSPDSRLSVWRSSSGTRWAVTTAEVTTGSVGVSTAPSRKASAQESSLNSSFAAEREEHQRERHRDHDRARRSAPVRSAAARARRTARRRTGSGSAPARSARPAPGSPGSTVITSASASPIPAATDEHRDREHGAVHQPRERGRDRDQQADHQYRLGEAHLHGDI